MVHPGTEVPGTAGRLRLERLGQILGELRRIHRLDVAVRLLHVQPAADFPVGDAVHEPRRVRGDRRDAVADGSFRLVEKRQRIEQRRLRRGDVVGNRLEPLVSRRVRRKRRLGVDA